MAATHDDAQVLMQLLRWGTELQLQDAVATILGDEFEPDVLDTDVAAVRTVLMFGETAGTLVKHGLLDRALLLDLFWMEGLWVKVEPSAQQARKVTGTDRMYENFEALVSA